MAADPRTWARAPRQARSRETFERFVTATRELLEEGRSFESIGVADIVARADRTVGSFYARFDDKEAVLGVLVQRLDDRIQQVVRAFCDPVRWEGEPASAIIGESVRLNVQAYRRAGPLFRAALTAAATDARFRRVRLDTMRFCAEQQKRLLRTRAGELRCASVDRASDRAFELVATTLDHELLFGRFTDTSPDNDLDLIGELTERCRYLLGADDGEATDDSASAVAPADRGRGVALSGPVG